MHAIGIDTGGTFTDFVWRDGDGHLRVAKRLSTPRDPSQAILDGLGDVKVPAHSPVIHGSTVATNALLERRGARTALVTTEGFADVIEIGRQNRPDIYALVPQKPEPLVPAAWRFVVRERVDRNGHILLGLSPQELTGLVSALEAHDIESVAVCLLYSFLNPVHEQAIERALTAAGTNSASWNVSLSVDILPEYREFERTAATVINAYVAPLMASYLRGLAAGVAPRSLTIMQSNGGVISAEVAADQAARTVLSGPAGGVVGALHVAQQAGLGDGDQAEIITFDMGGTSTDVALCPGRLPMTTESEVGGLPLRLPMIDIHTVGAGGGSLAHVDAGGALHVGPQSAGAEPGPACYHANYAAWEERLAAHFEPGIATVSDANLVLGRLTEDHFLGGTMKLNRAAATQALERLAQRMGVESAVAAAWGVIRIANANMVRAIRRISVERGYDPRRFTLVAFGGGGPLHACEMAEALRMQNVLVPRTPGVLSALGMLVAAPARNYSQTVMLALDETAQTVPHGLSATLDALQATATREMVSEGHPPEAISFSSQIDARYLGQSFELTIPLDKVDGPADVREKLDRAHRERYGYDRKDAAIEIVTARLTASTLSSERLQSPSILNDATTDAPDAIAERAVWLGTEMAMTPVYDREQFAPGMTYRGPALIVQYDTTTFIPAHWTARVDGSGSLLLHRESQPGN